MVEEHQGNFDDIEAVLKKRQREKNEYWAELEQAVVQEAEEGSEMYNVMVRKYGEKGVMELREKLG